MPPVIKSITQYTEARETLPMQHGVAMVMVFSQSLFYLFPKVLFQTFIASRTSRLFSQQVSKEKTGIPAVYMATLPRLPGMRLGTIKAIHDKAQGCSMS